MTRDEIIAKYGKKPDVLPSLVNWLREHGSTASVTSNSHFVMYVKDDVYVKDEQGNAIRDDNGRYVEGNHYRIKAGMNHACYACMTGQEIFKVRLFINQHLREEFANNEKNNALFFEWADYVMKRSPFKDVFLGIKNKKKDVWLRDGIGLNVKLPPSVVFSGAIMLREVWEFPDMIRGWKMFKEQGFTEDQAYICAHYFSVDNNGQPFFKQQGWSHHVMNGMWITQEDARNFVAHKYSCDEKPMREGCSSWGTCRMLSKVADTTADSIYWTFKRMTKKVGHGWDAKDVVPFDDKVLDVFKGIFDVK